jgi:hypothetical protein
MLPFGYGSIAKEGIVIYEVDAGWSELRHRRSPR